MSNLTGEERAKYVRTMFGQIASRYDLLNRLMTMGMDIKWRLEAISQLHLDGYHEILDVGTGTGDIALEIVHQKPDAFVVACDYTPEMLFKATQRQKADRVHWVICDAQYLPFCDKAFDRLVSGFLLRNVPDLAKTLSSQFRVLKNGGIMVSLDTTPPSGILKPFILIYFRLIIPVMGWIITGHLDAYRYLPSTTEKFFPASQLADMMRAAGFSSVNFFRRMVATIAIHQATK